MSRPELSKHPLTHRDAIVITTRDELTMVTYLTLPRGVPPRKLPMVLLVHGGPWERDSWGFDGVAQWLANRGYLVLQPNFRASLGFGKKYLHAGDRQWGGTMQNDLTDAVAWAIAKGYADPKRVAIMGTSYGGYAALAGLTFTPDLYACGIDVAGPSNLETLLEALPPYGSAMLGMLDLRMGDVGRDSLFNQRVSPLFHVDRIRSPLLVGHGANDPRVPLGESTRLVDAMRSRGLPVDFVVYADEGHGFVRPENRLDFYARVEQFWPARSAVARNPSHPSTAPRPTSSSATARADSGRGLLLRPCDHLRLRDHARVDERPGLRRRCLAATEVAEDHGEVGRASRRVDDARQTGEAAQAVALAVRLVLEQVGADEDAVAGARRGLGWRVGWSGGGCGRRGRGRRFGGRRWSRSRSRMLEARGSRRGRKAARRRGEGRGVAMRGERFGARDPGERVRAVALGLRGGHRGLAGLGLGGRRAPHGDAAGADPQEDERDEDRRDR